MSPRLPVPFLVVSAIAAFQHLHAVSSTAASPCITSAPSLPHPTRHTYAIFSPSMLTCSSASPPLHACTATSCSSPPSRNLHRVVCSAAARGCSRQLTRAPRGALARPKPRKSSRAAAPSPRKSDDGEVVVTIGLRGRIGWVLGLRGVPMHADGRAGAGDEGPAPSPLLQQDLAATMVAWPR